MKAPQIMDRKEFTGKQEPGSKLNTGTIIKLNKITRKKVKLYNRIVCKTHGCQCQLDNRVLDLRLHLHPSEETDAPAVFLRLIIDGQDCWLGLDKSFFRRQVERYLPMEHIHDLPLELRSATIEAAFEELLEMSERAIGTAIKIQAVRRQSPSTQNTQQIFFSLDVEGRHHASGQFSFSEPLLPLFLKALEKIPDSHTIDWEALPTTVYFEIGYTHLPVAELRTITTGDLILADSCAFARDRSLDIRITPGQVLKGKLQKKGVVIQKTTEKPMDEKNSDNIIDIDELQVRLVFDIGTKTIPFRELKTLQPGYTFELEQSVEKPITLRVNGQRIGTGKLVQIEDRIGVQIVELTDQKDG